MNQTVLEDQQGVLKVFHFYPQTVWMANCWEVLQTGHVQRNTLKSLTHQGWWQEWVQIHRMNLLLKRYILDLQQGIELHQDILPDKHNEEGYGHLSHSHLDGIFQRNRETSQVGDFL